MLPDFPGIKRVLMEQMAHAIQTRAASGSLLNSVKTHRLHEGDRNVVVREDGSRQVISFNSPLSAEVSVSMSEMRKDGPDASIRAVRRAGDALAEAMSKRMMETISEAAESVGNVVAADGKPFSLDLYADGLETMDLSFDASGNWTPPTLLMHPDLAARAHAAFESEPSDSPASQRIKAIISRKLEEHRAREARRTLVD